MKIKLRGTAPQFQSSGVIRFVLHGFGQHARSPFHSPMSDTLTSRSLWRVPRFSPTGSGLDKESGFDLRILFVCYVMSAKRDHEPDRHYSVARNKKPNVVLDIAHSVEERTD